MDSLTYEQAKAFILANNETLEDMSNHPGGLAFLLRVYTNLDKITYLNLDQKEAVQVFCESREMQEKFQAERIAERGAIKNDWGEK